MNLRVKNKNKKNNKIKGLQLSKKLNFCSPYFWKKTFLFQQSTAFKYTEKFVYSRSSTIPTSFIDQLVEIHSGKKWYGRVVTKWNIGFKFGELTWNRKIALYKAKQAKKKKKNK